MTRASACGDRARVGERDRHGTIAEGSPLPVPRSSIYPSRLSLGVVLSVNAMARTKGKMLRHTPAHTHTHTSNEAQAAATLDPNGAQRDGDHAHPSSSHTVFEMTPMCQCKLHTEHLQTMLMRAHPWGQVWHTFYGITTPTRSQAPMQAETNTHHTIFTSLFVPDKGGNPLQGGAYKPEVVLFLSGGRACSSDPVPCN